LLTYPSPFLFHHPALHRVLHSSPTRRSSDLRGAGPARLRGARVTHPTHRPVRTPLTMDCDLTGLLDVSQRPPAAAGGVSVRGPHPCGVECAAREDTAAADRRRGGAAARAG